MNFTRGLTESVLFAPKPRAEGSSPSAPAKTKRHLRVSFYFVVKAEGLEPRNSKVQALLTVNMECSYSTFFLEDSISLC